MINVNEILKDGLYDLVADIVGGGMFFVNDGYVVEGAWENDKMITFDDLLEIVNKKQVKRFLELEMKDRDNGNAKIKTLLKGYLLGSGLKLDNAMIVRMFNIVKEIVNEMAELSNKDKEILDEIKERDNIICTDFLQFVLATERYLLTLQDDYGLDLDEIMTGALKEWLEKKNNFN